MSLDNIRYKKSRYAFQFFWTLVHILCLLFRSNFFTLFTIRSRFMRLFWSNLKSIIKTIKSRKIISFNLEYMKIEHFYKIWPMTNFFFHPTNNILHSCLRKLSNHKITLQLLKKLLKNYFNFQRFLWKYIEYAGLNDYYILRWEWKCRIGVEKKYKFQLILNLYFKHR